MKKRLLSLALALVMCLSLLPSTVFAAGGDPVAINGTNFPDGNFRAYVRTLPGAEDNVFTQEELAAITEINCSDNQLASLKLGNTAKLATLDCHNNRLTSLDVSHHTALTDLDCSSNQLTSLELGNTAKLGHLDYHDNRLTALDVSHHTALTDLDCSSNQLTSLELGNTAKLATLDCHINQLTSLDLRQNPLLTWQWCSNNQRTAANGTALTALDPNFDPSKAGSIVGGSFDDGKVYFTADELTYVYDCGNGKTSGFKLVNAIPQSLAVYGGNFPDANFLAYVKTLPGAEDGSFTQEELAAITKIDCNGREKSLDKKIADLSGIEYFSALTALDCSCNRLTSLDLSKNTQLTHLYCDNNQHTVDNGTELTAMDPNFDPAKVSNIVDGSFGGGKVNFTTEELTYTYDCGNGHTAGFKLVKTPPVITMATITFRIVNGTWADGSTAEQTAMVTMHDGFGTLSPEQVPVGMIANPGYENGTWNKSPNITPGAVTKSVTYTYSFKAKPTLPFVDVTPGDWFYEGVRYTTTRGLFKGISRTEFGPTLPMTRSMVVQVLYNMAGKPKVKKTNQFVDVKDSDWFADAVAWGVKIGVTAGYPGGRFAPDDKVTREQLAVMLHGYRKKPAATEPLTFADTDDISDWAGNAVQWAVENHLMGGVPGNKILPQGLAERSQGAVIMMNFDQMPKN